MTSRHSLIRRQLEQSRRCQCLHRVMRSRREAYSKQVQDLQEKNTGSESTDLFSSAKFRGAVHCACSLDRTTVRVASIKYQHSWSFLEYVARQYVPSGFLTVLGPRCRSVSSEPASLIQFDRSSARIFTSIDYALFFSLADSYSLLYKYLHHLVPPSSSELLIHSGFQVVSPSSLPYLRPQKSWLDRLSASLWP